MTLLYLPLLIFLIVLAALVRETFVFTLLYLFLGVYILVRWWSETALNNVRFKRIFDKRAFPGDVVTVQLELENGGWLPVLWLQANESLPVALVGKDIFQVVTNLGLREKRRFPYQLRPKQRGYYSIGPLTVMSGDILGLTKARERKGPAEHIIVYPEVVPLLELKIPSRSPMGSLRDIQPIFEDPTRVRGKRDYVAGDSLRHVDWKSTATTGRMQVKLMEPSIALQTMFFLNLNENDFPLNSRLYATELAIVVAASLANWVIERQQSVGLVTNAIDSLQDNAPFQTIQPKKGRAHMMRLLEVMARASMSHGPTLVELMQRERPFLAWGTTLIVITGLVNEPLFDELFQARRDGLNAMLILCGFSPKDSMPAQEIRIRAKRFGIPFYHILDRDDLDVWRMPRTAGGSLK